MIENFYKENLCWNERISKVIEKQHSHIDDLILKRNPQLSFTKDGKIDLDKIYSFVDKTSNFCMHLLYRYFGYL